MEINREVCPVAALSAWRQEAKGGRRATSSYRVGSGSTIWQGEPLQRVFQDIHVAAQHGAVDASTLEVLGRMAFGFSTNALLI